VTAGIPQAQFVPVLGTHFLPLEQPDRIHHELVGLAQRAGTARGLRSARASGRGFTACSTTSTTATVDNERGEDDGPTRDEILELDKAQRA
jgi:hypothetical protein